MPDITTDWKPIPLKAVPAGGELETEAAPVGGSYYVSQGRKQRWEVGFCSCCCCCGPGGCCEPGDCKLTDWCCACCCPLCTFGASLGDGRNCGCDGWDEYGRGAWSFCCFFTMIDMVAGGVVYGIAAPFCAQSPALYLTEIVAGLPGGCYASWLRNKFRYDEQLPYNPKMSPGFWNWLGVWFRGGTSCFDTLSIASGLCWPCIAYQNIMEKNAPQA